MELFHTPDTMPDAPNAGSNTRSKPAGLGNQVRELHEQGLLPLFDEELLPTPTTGYSGRDPGKWRAERKPSNVGNERKITDLQVAMVELVAQDDDTLLLPTPMAQQAGNSPESWLRQASRHSATPRRRVGDLAVLVENGLLETGGELPVLPTPSAVDGSGGSMQQSLESLRAGRRQKHLTDLPRMLDLEAEGFALLPTPQTRDSTGGKPEAVNRGRGYGADLNDVAAAGLLDQAPLLPTPMSRDHQTGKRYALDPSHRFGPNLNDVATAGALGTDPVLPTPMARDHRAASPAEAMRNSPGLSSIGALLVPDDLPVLPTPMASLSEHRRDCGVDPEGRRAKGRQVSLADEVCYLPGQRDGALLPTPRAQEFSSGSQAAHPSGTRKSGQTLNEAVSLLPTPAARDSTGGVPSRLDRTQGAFLNDVAAAGLLPAPEPEKVKLLPTPTTSDSRGASCGGAHDENVRVPRLAAAMEVDLPAELAAAAKLKLLPTPTTLDHVEKRTTHAGGNPTLQGAICGTNPRDAERLKVKRDEPLLPTPAAWDTGGGRQHTTRGTTNGKVLSEAVREMPLLPTPQSTDHMCGSTTLQGRIDSNRQVMLPHVVRELPLLPTPKAHDGVFGTPRTTGRPIEKSTHLQTIVSLMGLPDAPLLPTPTSSDGSGGGVRTNLTWEGTTRSTGDGGNSRLRDVVGLFGLDEALPVLPTPKASDHKGTDSECEWSRNTPGLAAISFYYGTGLDDAQDDSTDLMPTPQARDWKGAPGRNYKNRNLARDMERLAAEQAAPPAADEPEPEVVVNQHGDEQFVLFPTPNVGARNVRNSPGEMARRTPALGAVVADLVESAGPLLPTPNVGAREVRNSPGEMARLHPALGAVVADLAELGDASRFHGTPLLPTPVVTDSCGARNSTAWRSDPESKAKIGDTLTDAMWKLAADRGEMVLPDGPSQARFTDTALLPTPVARDCNGHIQAPTADVGNNGRSVSLGDVLSRLPEGGGTLFPTPRANASDGTASTPAERRAKGQSISLSEVVGTLPMLPTPMTVNRTSRRAQTGRPTSGPSRSGPSYGLEDVATDLFPTPNAADGDRGGSDPRKLRDNNHMVKLIDAVLDGELQQEEILMPTPKTAQRGDCPSERERNSPDLAATTAHFPAGRWGKYGPAVERWEKLTRPAPAPTEPNKNGNPRLTARFSEWLLGWPEGWVTDPEIGIARTGQLRLIGNGVVPQQAATALVMLLQAQAEEQKQATHGG